jgi:hypothetical protein
MLPLPSLPGNTRQSNSELSELAGPAIDTDRAAMLLGHDVVADREAKAGSLASRLGREERLKELIPDLRRDTKAIVADADLHCLAEFPIGEIDHLPGQARRFVAAQEIKQQEPKVIAIYRVRSSASSEW